MMHLTKAFLLILFLFMTLQLSGATVTKVDMVKKNVLINEGINSGFIKKVRVCFYEEDKKIACGTVKVSNNKISAIKMSEKTLSKIKEGHEARIEKIASKAEPVITTPSSFSSYIKGFSVFPLVNSITYSNLVYETPTSNDVESMWSSDSSARSFGGGLEFGLGFNHSLLALGARVRMFNPKRIASDYEDANNDKYFERYAETVGNGKSTGLYIDYYYLNSSLGAMDFKLSNGIDIDQSTVKFVMDLKEDNVGDFSELYNATSSLTAIFLRTNLLLDFNFGSLGVDFGSTILIPLTQNAKFTLSQSDPFTDRSLIQKTAEEDVKSKLGHQAKVGLDLTLAAYYRF